MQNSITLYNPYYQESAIEEHINMLLSCQSATTAKTAFGKVRSKLRTDTNDLVAKYQTIYSSVNENNPLQLFLTDYSSMYVARAIKVTTQDCYNIAPNYYKEKSLDVELWFVITDIRRIVNKDFELLRDKILANFKTPHFGNHRYAIYGNQYTYPMQIEMIDEINYFEYEPKNNYRYFTDIFKSDTYQDFKQKLIDFRFGTLFYNMHPNSQDGIVSAEIEYSENKDDSLYDFSSVVIKYSKAVEMETYLFLKSIFKFLMSKNRDIAKITYSVQSNNFTFNDFFANKPNLGTYKFLLKNDSIKYAIKDYIEDYTLKQFLLYNLFGYINTVQQIRNESAHGSATSKQECDSIRNSVIGIGCNGILGDLIGGALLLK